MAQWLYIIPVGLVYLTASLLSKYLDVQTEDRQKKFLWWAVGSFVLSAILAFVVIPLVASYLPR